MSSHAGRVVTLGMLIIDQFEYATSSSNFNQVQEEQLGGGGTYAMVGGRAFLPPEEIGMIIDVGTDFPSAFDLQLRSYGESMFFFRKGDRLTTRALNIYSYASIAAMAEVLSLSLGYLRSVCPQSSGEERGFRYLTPKIRISPLDISTDTTFASSTPPSYIHFVCSPLRAQEIADESRSLGWADTALIWEPMPSDCVPSELENVKSVAPHVAVISPNHLEALILLSVEPSKFAAELRSQISLATTTLLSFLSPGGSAVVRSGGFGVCWASMAADGIVNGPNWIPPVFGEAEQDRVKDVTGGGNGFLGGLCAGLKLTAGDISEAILYGSVAASFAIEQSGLPQFVRSDDGREAWNGSDSGVERLDAFRTRLAEAACDV